MYNLQIMGPEAGVRMTILGEGESAFEQAPVVVPEPVITTSIEVPAGKPKTDWLPWALGAGAAILALYIYRK